MVTGDVIRSEEVQGLVTTNTLLGWTLQGPIQQSSALQRTPLVTCVLSAQVSLDDGL